MRWIEDKKIIINSEIIRREDNKLKEEITLRKASRDLVCYECEGIIKKGEKYIRDKHFYLNESYWSYSGFVKKTRVNFICLNCWKGELPKQINKNEPLINYSGDGVVTIDK